MELLQLEYFRIVAQTENITKAAELLQVSQPFLSKTITRLEDSLGVKLFTRNGRSIHLNQEGKTFLEYVNRVFYELEEGQRSIKVTQERSTRLAVVTNMPIAISDVYSKFQQQYKDIEYYQYFADLEGINSQINNGLADVAVVDVSADDEHIDFTDLLEDELLAIVPNSYHTDTGRCIELSALSNERIGIFPRGNPIRTKMDDFFKRCRIRPNIFIEDINVDRLLEMVLNSEGITFTTKFIVYSLFTSDGMKAKNALSNTKLLRLNPSCRYRIGIILSKKSLNPVLASKLYKCIVEYYLSIGKDYNAVCSYILCDT